jgi:hypothetical protein
MTFLLAYGFSRTVRYFFLPDHSTV